MANKKDINEIRCSFCGKAQEMVKKLIAGPKSVYICDECINVCNNIMENEISSSMSKIWIVDNLTKQLEIIYKFVVSLS